jgi:transposase, IS5 family
MQEIKENRGVSHIPRVHKNKTKKHHLFISRYSKSPAKKRQRAVKKRKRKFIEQLERMLEAATSFATEHVDNCDPVLSGIALEMLEFLPAMRKVLRTAKKVWLAGEVVPAKDRVYSIFEPHTELIKRGRSGKPVEFGHMILLGQTREKFITQFNVMRKKIHDSLLNQGIVDKHEESFGAPPETLVADKGFRAKAKPMEELAKRVDNVAIPRVLKDWTDPDFVDLHHFRAGIEGSISVLKRAFGLLRCQYRGFRSFASHVGMGVVCHNLVLLAKMTC